MGRFSTLISLIKHRMRVHSQETEADSNIEEPGRKENPYLNKLRMILEQILEQYHMSYREFHPLLIDTDTPPESMLDEDDVATVLGQISEDLNFLQIVTDRPAYFMEYIERMYEDTGLVVLISEKEELSAAGVNVVLDMEQTGGCRSQYIRDEIRYIPLYKKNWKQADNLDIYIPIGYNTVIVKGL